MHCAHCHDHKYDPITQFDYFRFRAIFEPMHVRQDRVAGEADPGPFQEYEYSTLRKVQRLGAVRVFDKASSPPTWFYTGGDERNRVPERGSIPPGLPAFLVANDAPRIEPVELPPRAYYPGLQPAIQATAVADAQSELARAETELTQLASAEPAPEPRRRAAEAKVLAARAELASVEARIAADRAKHGETPIAAAAELTHIAARREREAAVSRANANVLTHEAALADAEALPETDAGRTKAIADATAGRAAARDALAVARGASMDAFPTDYSGLSPVYPTTSSGRRRALALWITSRANPLTARVAVNHMWLRHFHQPLVATVFDFGRSGAAPTHPELLDWLAVELVESGWSMKHLHRLLVTSEAYQRASSAGGASLAAERDPEDRLLWRFNVGRMEAEVVRDSVLFLADRLDLTQGGQELENSMALTTYRRSLYYSCQPEEDGKNLFGALFDGPEPADCYRRTRTVAPQQALALTNSELVHDASTALAAALAVDNPTARTFVMAAFERVLCRAPSAAELAACEEFLLRPPANDASADPSDAARQRASLVRALLNHGDFVSIR